MVKTSIKRLLRPLIPNRVMARYRLRQHSRHSRCNVDVFLPDPRLARRWLTATPDTYRVRLEIPQGLVSPDLVIVGDPSLPVDDSRRVMAGQAMSDPWLAAVVVGEVETPSIVDRRRVEPLIAPRLIVVRPEVLDEVGGVPPGNRPFPGLLARIRDAGHPLGLIPIAPEGTPGHRTDPIDRPAVVILAAVPMHDIGGGARSTQLAMEFLRQGFHVTLLSLYDSQESVDLGLRYIHPALEQNRVTRFDPAALIDRVAEPGLVLVEAPAPMLVDKARFLAESGWEVVYDLIDDWSDPALGGDWFDPDVERGLVDMAHRVVASAPDLVERLWQIGREAALVPNAVNVEVFGVDLPHRPDDLPEAETIIGYHGSLYGDWFDWEALKEVADAFPDAAVVVIGDDKASRPEMPGNVHFLGLKAQTDLPAYLQRMDAGLIPFKLNDTTHAVSPLKAYEYLASGVPVAAPPLRSLDGLAGIFRDPDMVKAVRAALEGEPPGRTEYLTAHSWAERMDSILSPRFKSDNRVRGAAANVPPSRPAVHWRRDQRLRKGDREPQPGSSARARLGH